MTEQRPNPYSVRVHRGRFYVVDEQNLAQGAYGPFAEGLIRSACDTFNRNAASNPAFVLPCHGTEPLPPKED